MHLLRILTLLLAFVALLGAHATGAQQVTLRMRRGPAVTEGFAVRVDDAGGLKPWRDGDAAVRRRSRDSAAAPVLQRGERRCRDAVVAQRRCWAEAMRRVGSRPAYGAEHEPPLSVSMFGIDAPRSVPLMLFD